MPRSFCAVFVAVLVSVWVLPGVAGAWSLTILHTNDVHSRLVEFDGSGRLCLEDADDCVGGMARLVAAVRAERARGGAVLLVDAGDQFMGTPLFQAHRGLGAAAMMRLAGYDAMAVGNHEFDLGAEVLGAFAAEVPFPLLAANVEVPGHSALARRLAPYAVVVREGRKVGIIGAVTPQTASLAKDSAGLTFTPVAPAVQMAAHELAASGVDVVVCLTHQGYAEDKKLAASVSGLDVIVGGHTHTVLGDGPGARGPYPTVGHGPSGQPVLVVTDGKWGRALGRIEVEFDAAGLPVSWSGAPVPLGHDAPRDPEALALERGYVAELQSSLNQPAGALRLALDGERASCRRGECVLGDVVADAALEALRGAGAEIALINAGSIRAGLPAGKLTRRDLVQALPFGNSLVLARIVGADLLAALEHGVSRAASGQEDQGGTGRFLQVSGMRYAWAPGGAPGMRLVSAEVRRPGGGYEMLDPGREYVVVLNDYLAVGGDGYAMLARGARGAYDTSIPLVEALGDWITARSPLAARPDGRILCAGSAP